MVVYANQWIPLAVGIITGALGGGAGMLLAIVIIKGDSPKRKDNEDQTKR